MFFVAKHRKIIGVFAFLVPGRHLIRTSSLPPYGVARQKFVRRSAIYHQKHIYSRMLVRDLVSAL
ncbi:hypothetical protein D9F89_19240 [Escherichia coli]|nr:hypothetical protein [Escherichia coli]EFN5200922.1 hypothetical protein [Escherichia coli]EFN5725923.1 hypothetical protein [Escherichia coli]MHU11566.1 hypothetical protein [Escherichia coli]